MPATRPMPASRTIGCVILDWAGTAVDFGCMAPVEAFVATLAEAGLKIDAAAARGPMGLEKRAHLRALLDLPEIVAQWRMKTGAAPDEALLDRLYARFRSVQIEVIPRHAAPIPGLIEAVAALRAAGITIGSNSGYDSAMMAALAARAAAAGYAPDVVISSDDAARGRPFPDMAWLAAMRLGAPDAARCVKVDDTTAGVAEGVNAGMWSIGVTDSGNEVGLAQADWQALTVAERAVRRAAASDRLHAAGAHLVIDTVANLPAAITSLNARLAAGERP